MTLDAPGAVRTRAPTRLARWWARLRTGAWPRAWPWLAAALALAPLLARAQGGPGRPAPAVGYADRCAQGNAKYAARDFAGAVALYRAAIELEPRDPLAHYLLGEAQLAAGDLAEAEAGFGRAAIESGEKDPALHARALFVLADLKERQSRWSDAKAAWQTYLDWLARFPTVPGFAASARSRQQVIDAMLAQDKASEAVRRRIAETKDGGVFTDLSKTP